MKLAALIVGLMAATPALAQSTTDSEALSQSTSNVIVEGSKSQRYVPSMGANAIPTAECQGATSGAISGPGFGVAFGGGNTRKSCETRMNAAMLQALVGNPPAVTYVCMRDAEMRAVLQVHGYCRDKLQQALWNAGVRQ